MIYLHSRKIAEFQKVCDDYQHKALNTRLSETAMSTKAFGPEVAKRRTEADTGPNISLQVDYHISKFQSLLLSICCRERRNLF